MKNRAAMLLFAAACAFPQTPNAPPFEVASIKATHYDGGPLRVTGRFDPDGINFSQVTLRLCIQRAYGVKPNQVSGPEWISTERYTIIAKAAGATPESKLMLMLGRLLAERFKLALHREQKEMPVYALVVGKNGAKMQEAKDEGATQIGGGDGAGVKFERASMDQLGGVLARSLDRPVVDETGLKGLYNFTLLASEMSKASDVTDNPSIFTAVQEQLGLRLEAKKAMIEILVVDRAEKPSDN
jgi:uncharacterized protein (TIGR03435 family)